MRYTLPLALALTGCAQQSANTLDGEEIGRSKVTICHQTSSATNPQVVIRVSTAALDTHVDRHGDWVVTDEVPGDGIDNDCDPSTPDEPDEPDDDLTGTWTLEMPGFDGEALVVCGDVVGDTSGFDATVLGFTFSGAVDGDSVSATIAELGATCDGVWDADGGVMDLVCNPETDPVLELMFTFIDDDGDGCAP